MKGKTIESRSAETDTLSGEEVSWCDWRMTSAAHLQDIGPCSHAGRELRAGSAAESDGLLSPFQNLLLLEFKPPDPSSGPGLHCSNPWDCSDLPPPRIPRIPAPGWGGVWSSGLKNSFFFFFKYIYWLCYYSCPISPPHSTPSCPHPSLPHSPPIVHVHGSYL